MRLFNNITMTGTTLYKHHIRIYGFNDVSSTVPDFFNDLPEGNGIGMWELTVSDDTSYGLFSYLNSNSNYSSKRIFIEGLNNRLEDLFGTPKAKINHAVIESVYDNRNKFSYIYGVGCLSEEMSNIVQNGMVNQSLINEIRYSRSVQITKNIMHIIDTLSSESNISIFVGEPHREFIEHFLTALYSEKYDISSECHSSEFNAKNDINRAKLECVFH